jgi:hypothetical protein
VRRSSSGFALSLVMRVVACACAPGRERPCTCSNSTCQFAFGAKFSSPFSPEMGGYRH